MSVISIVQQLIKVLLTFILPQPSHEKETTTHGQIVKFVNWYKYQAFKIVFSEMVISQSLPSQYNKLQPPQRSHVQLSIFFGVIETISPLAVITSAREIFALSNAVVSITIVSVLSSIT